MESNTFMMPLGGKSILRSTGEEVEIIDSQFGERGARTDEDWVTYIDSKGVEHIKEHLNIQLDFKAQVNDVFSKLLNEDWKKGMPSTRNNRIYEVAKEFLLKGYKIDVAIESATEFVDTIGIETN